MNAKVKRTLGLFRVKAEERVQAVVALAVIVALNTLFIRRLHELFLQPGFGPYIKVFQRELHLAGYDHIKAADRKVMRKRECEFLGLDPYKEGV